jgi:hypothetical protein
MFILTPGENATFKGDSREEVIVPHGLMNKAIEQSFIQVDTNMSADEYFALLSSFRRAIESNVSHETKK